MVRGPTWVCKADATQQRLLLNVAPACVPSAAVSAGVQSFHWRSADCAAGVEHARFLAAVPADGGPLEAGPLAAVGAVVAVHLALQAVALALAPPLLPLRAAAQVHVPHLALVVHQLLEHIPADGAQSSDAECRRVPDSDGVSDKAQDTHRVTRPLWRRRERRTAYCSKARLCHLCLFRCICRRGSCPWP